MARDWSNEDKTFALLAERLHLIAPDNTAPVPIACAMERDEEGDLAWTVDIHVRVPYVTEYDVSAAGKTLTGALRRAYLGLNSHGNLIYQAARASSSAL